MVKIMVQKLIKQEISTKSTAGLCLAYKNQKQRRSARNTLNWKKRSNRLMSAHSFFCKTDFCKISTFADRKKIIFLNSWETVSILTQSKGLLRCFQD